MATMHAMVACSGTRLSAVASSTRFAGASRHVPHFKPFASASMFSGFMGTTMRRISPALQPVKPRHTAIGEAVVPRVQRAQASFFGVGAPEALLVGVVALLVFGPKGLAEAARSVGSLLRSFQPTIRELADVSNDLKSTLEKEIGLDEIRQELQRPPSPSPSKAGPAASTTQLVEATDEVAKVVDPDIEAKRAAAAAAAWGGATPAQPAASTEATASSSTDGVTSSSSASAAEPSKSAPAPAPLATLSMEELEAELARRKATSVPKEIRAEDK